MMGPYRVRLTGEASADLVRLYSFPAGCDADAAERGLAAIERGFDLLADSPFSCRRAEGGDPSMREIVIRSESAGYVALFQIDDEESVTILAVRHQRESEYR